MSTITTAELETIGQLPPGDRPAALAALARQVLSGEAPGGARREALIAALVAAVEGGLGAAADRLVVGEALGVLGDPRLRLPDQEGYWARSPLLDGEHLTVGRYPVTNAEFRAFVAAGGYGRDDYWSDDGRAWRDASADDTWGAKAEEVLDACFLVANQPVVGVTWYEAEAYARYAGGRLLGFRERMGVVRGPDRRPYPWGEPFGHGNANTREEVLGRPCAVGLYRRDCTPEGVFDLAGNVAEWVADEVDGKGVIAPGAWSQESLSSWAKARALQAPSRRGSDLGFRIARD